MADKPTPTPGILTLSTTALSTTFNIALSIPPQTLRLVGYRVEYGLAAEAVTAQVLYIELPFLSSNQVLDGNLGHVYLPLPLSNSSVTNITGLNIPIYINQAVPQKFDMYVRDGAALSFALAANDPAVTLQFALESGHLA